MNKCLPRIVAMHDLSGYGKCSLTVVLPILSIMKIQVCPIPTAILSSNSDGLGEFSFLDFTPYMKEYIDHWKKLKLKFKGIYTGFLGSYEQISIVSNFIDEFKKENQLVIVDPVMGDNGVVYKTYTNEMVNAMFRLVRKADIITPNLTEAFLLLKLPYKKKCFNKKYAKEMLLNLSKLGPEKIIITSFPFEDKTYANIAYDKIKNKYYRVDINYTPKIYPGTGDIYTSIIVGKLINGYSLPIAMNVATNFVEESIKKSRNINSLEKEGVYFEYVLKNFFNSKFKNKTKLF